MTIWPGDVLSVHCDHAQQLVAVAPYMKADALSRILTNINPGASLICVTRWNVQDIVEGASDIQCYAIVRDLGGSFRLHPSLHAKYYRVDDMVFVGSANLTYSAMGWTAEPNLEIFCQPGDDFDASKFQQVVMGESREISDDEFRSWQDITDFYLENGDGITGNYPELDTWRPTTRDPRDLVLSYRGRENHIASYDERRASRRDITALQIPANFTDRQVKEWMSICLLCTPFANGVLQAQNTDDVIDVRVLAAMYKLSHTEARRGVETVQNWLAFLDP